MTFDIAPFRSIYPFESHYFNRDGIKLHYLDEGFGPPIIMVHGNPTWSLYFRKLVENLRDGCRVIVPDHIGCGLSDKPGDERYSYTLKSRADDLESLLEHLGIQEDVTLMLHDWGGAIGMAWAARHPERVKRLILLNTAAFLLPAGKRFPWPLWLVRNSFLGAFLVRGFNAFSFIATYVACKKGMTRELRRAYTAPYNSWRNRIATLRFVQDVPLRPGDASYDLIKATQDGVHQFDSIPTLICWGGKDFVFDHHFLREWKKRLPNAEVHTFPEAGHYVLEDAAAEIIPLIRAFLEAHPISRES